MLHVDNDMLRALREELARHLISLARRLAQPDHRGRWESLGKTPGFAKVGQDTSKTPGIVETPALDSIG